MLSQLRYVIYRHKNDYLLNYKIYVRNYLCVAQIISLERNQANYLFAVMRQTVGNQILIFNNCDGEWLAEIINGNKRFVKLKCLNKKSYQYNH